MWYQFGLARLVELQTQEAQLIAQMFGFTKEQ